MEKTATKKTVPRNPAGFLDVFAEDVISRNRMIETITSVYRKYGFSPLETPAIEYLEVLGKYLPESNEPEGGVFAFKDDDEEWISLRYDLTAPLSRVTAQYGNDLPSPYRRYQVGPVWRREKPGPGRFRQFYQCDFDTVGSSSLAADAEACAVLASTLCALGISQKDFEIRVNNRKILNGVLESIGVSSEGNVQLNVLRAVDKLDRVGLEGVRELLGKGRRDESGDFTKGAELKDCQIEKVSAFVSAGIGASSRLETLERLADLVGSSEIGREGIAELRQMSEFLDCADLSSNTVKFDPTVVRGLGYYTGPVFEAVLTFEIVDEKGLKRSFGSVAGGGRYDDLVARFTGNKVPATGGSIGLDRLRAALAAINRGAELDFMGPVVVTAMDKSRIIEYQKMVHELRAAGVDAEMYLGDKGFKAQMKYADKRKSPAVIIAGEDEFLKGEISLKDMRLGSSMSKDIEDRDTWRKAQPAQQSIPRADMLKAVLEIIKR